MRKETDILVFDSGAGGFTIFEEIHQLLPQAKLLLACDNAAYPYGTKSDQDILYRVDWVLRQLIEKYQPKIIVLACNTASTIALLPLRKKITLPIIGVVPAIKPAAQRSQSKIIGLLATPATIDRSYTTQLINDFASHCHVVRIGSRELVDMAERKIAGMPVDDTKLRTILLPFQQLAQLDTIVLGCTHFPLLRDEIARQLPHVALIDSGPAIAQQTARIISQQRIQLNRPSSDHHQCRAVFTKNSFSPEHWLVLLRKYNIEVLEYLND